MSIQPATQSRAGADAILHPQFLRDRLAPVLGGAGRKSVPDDHGRFDRLRSEAARGTASVGVAHPGAKGRAVHRAKHAIRRALYWYVEPPLTALTAANLALVDVVESLSNEVDRLRAEVASLRRDHDTAMNRPVQREAAASLDT